MAIWHGTFLLDYVKQHSENTLVSQLGIEFIEAGDDYLSARMPVDARTRQPANVLHGGASVALAETLASWAATFVVDRNKNYCVGLEINANHVRAATSGWVIGTARPVHLGRSTQVWEVRITDESQRLVCISRVTMAVLATANRYGNPTA
ncbi:MAG TPA: hotdog fold thioesterase [Polyangiaceae bacterium]|nr:hotdog fold thioesterase [Polyangiaceae bacterium]